MTKRKESKKHKFPTSVYLEIVSTDSNDKTPELSVWYEQSLDGMYDGDQVALYKLTRVLKCKTVRTLEPEDE